MSSHLPSQRYLSTRGGSYGFSFEQVVLKGLAEDGGLFIPEEIPTLPEEWSSIWPNLSFVELAHHIFSLYISPEEIPAEDLKRIVERSYSTFRAPEIAPLVNLDEDNNLHLLELFHGPTFAFKDVALQFLGNLFEYFLTRRNRTKDESQREHLSVIGATSGDTGSAAIYGLRGKKDVSVFMMYPEGKISPTQEAQMTTVLDENVHNIAMVDSNFDDCQATLKALFQDPETNATHKLGAVNSINWARILAQITYYFYSYASLLRSGRFSPGSKVRYAVPCGNFGDILAGYYAKRMGLPAEKLVVATNENDILHRFWESGYYEKKPTHGRAANGDFSECGVKAHEEAVRKTHSPAMDILVSSNFERLLWYLAFDVYGHGSLEERRKIAGAQVKSWLEELKSSDGFGVDTDVSEKARADFESERVSDPATLETIRAIYSVKTPAAKQGASQGTEGIRAKGGYILDPHTAVGVAAARRSMGRAHADTHHIVLATAHPAKFSEAVELALKENEAFNFNDLLPEQFKEFESLPRRVSSVKESDRLAGVRSIIRSKVPSMATHVTT